MNPIVLSAVLTGVGGLTNLLGSFWSGEISQEQFDREMDFKKRELGESIRNNAALLGLKREELKAQVEQFLVTMKENKRQFGETMGLKNKELTQQNKQFQQTLGLQKESLAHTKFMDVINPILERQRKTEGVLQGFTQMVKAGGGVANPLGSRAPGAAPMAQPTSVPLANPITVGA